ncbi:MAG: hypothetical protein V3T81_04325 [Thermoanaerobaculia bacterium]
MRIRSKAARTDRSALGVPLLNMIDEAEIFSDGFESGDTSAWQ